VVAVTSAARRWPAAIEDLAVIRGWGVPGAGGGRPATGVPGRDICETANISGKLGPLDTTISIPMKYLLCMLLSAFAVTASAADSPIQLLKDQAPELYKLYQRNAAYQPAFAQYAQRQGFRGPVEQLATVVHELIHIESAVHAGFFIGGTYYEPYLRADAWPALSNAQVAGEMQPQEKGNIYQFYVLNSPKNTIANVIDELNAYSQVATFICRNEATSGDKQVRNMIGHLNLLEAYFRTLRSKIPDGYRGLARNREARGAVATIVSNTRVALGNCGVDVRQIPRQEADFFLNNQF
jgi:hypothetical protein